LPHTNAPGEPATPSPDCSCRGSRLLARLRPRGRSRLDRSSVVESAVDRSASGYAPVVGGTRRPGPNTASDQFPGPRPSTESGEGIVASAVMAGSMPAWAPYRSDRPSRHVRLALHMRTASVTITALILNTGRAGPATRQSRPEWPERRERTVSGGRSRTGKGDPCNRVQSPLYGCDPRATS